MVDDSSAEARRAAFEAALGNEYFALNGIRGSTTAESSARATLYFTTLSGTLLALGFLAGDTQAAVPVAYAAVPTVAVLGVLAFLRLVELAALDVRAVQSMQHIRRHWRDLDRLGPSFFPAQVEGQAVDIVLDTGERRGLFRATLTMASSVALVNSLWMGSAVGFGAAHAGAPVAVGVLLGIACGALLVLSMFRHQGRRIGFVVDNDVPTSEI